MATSSRPARFLPALLVAAAGAFLLAFAARADATWSEDHMTEYFCAIGPAELQHARVVRVVAAVLGVVLLAASALLARWALRRSGADVAKSVLRAVVPAVLALVCCDAVLRVTHREPATWGEDCNHAEFYRHDATYGWAHLPSRTLRCQVGGRTVDYSTNAFEVRARSEQDATDPAVSSIVFAGESIAWGDGLRYDETYPAIVGKELGIQSVNVAVGAFGPDQVYLRTLEFLGRLAHPVAVVTMMVPPEIDRIVAPDRAHLALTRSGELALVPETPKLLRDSPLLRLWHAISRYHGEEAILATRAVIAATAKAVRERGAYPLFVLTPFNFGEPCLPTPEGVPRVVHRLFDGLDAPLVVVDIDPTWNTNNPRHPDTRGARKLAGAIVRALDGKISPR